MFCARRCTGGSAFSSIRIYLILLTLERALFSQLDFFPSCCITAAKQAVIMSNRVTLA